MEGKLVQPLRWWKRFGQSPCQIEILEKPFRVSWSLNISERHEICKHPCADCLFGPLS